MELKINADLLRTMLRDAYEAGWYGVRELADEQVDAIIKKNEHYLEKIKPVGNVGPGHIDGNAVYGTEREYVRYTPLNMSDHPVLGGTFTVNPTTFNVAPAPVEWDFNRPEGGINITQSQGHTIQLTDLPAVDGPPPEAWQNVGDG